MERKRRFKEEEPTLPPPASGFPFIAPAAAEQAAPPTFQTLEETRRRAEEAAKRATQARLLEDTQIRLRAEAAERQRLAEESQKVAEEAVRTFEQKTKALWEQRQAQAEAARKEQEAIERAQKESAQKEQAEMQEEDIKKAQAAVASEQCPFGGKTPCVGDDEKLAKCVHKLCENLGQVDSSGLLCDDKDIKETIQRDLFYKFGITDTDWPGAWEKLAKAMEKCRRADRITVMENFIATLFSYLKTWQRGGDEKNKASPKKIAALEKFINALHERLEMEDKLGCAGDKCGEPDDPDKFLKFDEIAGAATEKNLIRRGFILPAKYPGLFPDFAKAILFFGPPGTGKTLLAQAAAREIPNAAFFAPTPADLKGGVVGETEKKIKNVFECACERLSSDPTGKYKQAVLFFDEFESVAAQRGGAGAGVSSSALTVPTLLQYLEGSAAKRVEKGGPITVMAATNLPWCLDSAIIRRFPIQVMVDLPDAYAREFIIRDKLNRAFSKFIPEKDFAAYAITENPDKSKPNIFHITGNASALFKGRAYTSRNFKITLEMDGSGRVKGDSGGIYKDMLNIFLRPKYKISVDHMVEFIVKLTGPGTSADAYKYRKFSEDERQREHSELATSKYGFSASDVAKVMDNIISATGQRALDGLRSNNWGVYKIFMSELAVPAYIEKFILVAEKGYFAGTLIENTTEYDAEKMITWDLDLEKEIGFIPGNNKPTVRAGPDNPIGVGTIDAKQYEHIVYYNDTRQTPIDKDTGLEVKC